MSGFFNGTKRFALPILSLVILAAVSSDANAEKSGKDKSSTTLSSLAFLSDGLDVLNQYGRAAWRLADPRQVMLIRVVDAAGEPIAGASVRSFTITHIARGSSTSFIFDTLEDTLCRMAFTQADGTARVVRPTSKEQGVDVRVRADGYVPLSARWNEYARTAEMIPPEFTFTLEPSQPIGGVVHDASGHPIAGAEVSLTLQDNNRNTRIKVDLWQHEERTDAEGRWR
ncbi:MAG: carboxypeptidase-like regulatory domain-containing protein, partial [Patescibacteria group bacterium]|nr:carboxypeptidase-like regulatory domain-containing protein [Patescibacteria group bacterium]